MEPHTWRGWPNQAAAVWLPKQVSLIYNLNIVNPIRLTNISK